MAQNAMHVPSAITATTSTPGHGDAAATKRAGEDTVRTAKAADLRIRATPEEQDVPAERLYQTPAWRDQPVANDARAVGTPPLQQKPRI